MLPDWVSNPGPLTYESGALLIALRGRAGIDGSVVDINMVVTILGIADSPVFWKRP